MSTITIPDTPEEALASLDGVGKLLTAGEWTRAAIVYALVGPAQGEGARTDRGSSATVGIRELAAMRIHGLTSHHTVLRYRDAWQGQIDKGLTDPIPFGYAIEYDDDDPNWTWPPDEAHPRLDNSERRVAVEQQAAADGVSAASAIRVAESPAAMAAAIKADPATRAAAAEALKSTAEGQDAYFQAISRAPEAIEDHQRSRRAHNEQVAAETEQTYHLRGFKALPVLWDAENLAEYIETKVARDPEDILYARTAGLWLRSIGNRIVAWADGETVPLSDDDFAAEIEQLLGDSR